MLKSFEFIIKNKRLKDFEEINYITIIKTTSTIKNTFP
jgi:hypothetical protein